MRCAVLVDSAYYQLDLSVSVPVKAGEEDDAHGERQQINILVSSDFSFSLGVWNPV